MKTAFRFFLFCLFVLSALPARADRVLFLSSVSFQGTSASGGRGHGIEIDGSGNLFVAGSVDNNGTGRDIWIGKFDQDLVLLSSAAVDGGGNQNDLGYDLALDGAGSVYVVGESSDPTGGATNVWLGRFDSDLILTASATFEGSGQGADAGYALARSPSGDLFVAGKVYNASELDNIWIGKYTAELVFVGSVTRAGFGLGTDEGAAIRYSGGKLYATGMYTGFASASDIWLAELDTDLKTSTEAFFSAGASFFTDRGRGILREPASGDVFAIGGIQQTNSNIWLGKWDSGFVRRASSSLDGSQGTTEFDRGEAIELDALGNLALTGTSYEAGTQADVWVAMLDQNLVVRASHTVDLGGSIDEGRDIAVASSGDIFVAGIAGAGASGFLGKFQLSEVAPRTPSFGTVSLSSAEVFFGLVNAEGYSVDASTALDFSGVVLTSATPSASLSTLTVTGLEPNTTYHFRAGALWSGATAYADAVTTATLAAAPAAAAAAFETVGVSSIAAAWDRNGNPAGITTYTVVMTTGASFPNAFSGNLSTALAPAGASPQGLVEGLARNTTYHLFVGAVSHGGTFSDFTFLGATATLAARPLGAAETFPGVHFTSFTAAWDPDQNPVAFTTYTVHASTAADFNPGASGGAFFTTAPAAGAFAAMTGLGPNTTYYFRVRAENHNGLYSDYSALGATSTLSALPSTAVSTFSGIAVSSATVFWEANGNPLGVTTYTVVMTTDSSYPNAYSGNALLSTAPAGGSPAATLTTLSGNTTYFLFVQSLDHGGRGSAFVPLGSTRTRTNPPLGAGTTFFLVNSSSFSAAWNANGNPLVSTEYIVDASTAPDFNDGVSDKVNFATSPAGGPFVTVSPLNPNTTYFVRVRVAGQPEILVLGSTVTLAVKPPALSLSFLEVSLTSATVRWSPLPAAPSSASASGYVLEASSTNFGAGKDNLPVEDWHASGKGGVIHSSATTDIAVATLSITGLAGHTRYYFRVGSVNRAGDLNYTDLGSTIPVTFARTGIDGAAGQAQDVSAGDYDADGDLDLVFAMPGTTDEYVAVNAGDGTFTRVPAAGSAGNSRAVAWGDFDNDGDLDAAVGNDQNEDTKILRNDGGTLVALTLGGTFGNTYGIAWADYDNDGDMDLGVANAQGQNEYLLRNNADGTMTQVVLSGTVGDSRGLSWGDYDGDGYADLAVANASGEDDYIAVNNGDGTFTKKVLTGTGGDSGDAAWGDADGDGDLDLAIVNFGGPGFNTTDDEGESEVLARNNGGGTFSLASFFAGGRSRAAAWADYDDDGDLDLLVGNDGSVYGQNEYLARNDGNGVLTGVRLAGTLGYTQAVAWGDFDGDGDLDWAAANSAGFPGTEYVARNDTGTVVNAAPGAPALSAADLVLTYEFGKSTFTVKWAPGDFDARGATATVSYALAIGTAPMTLSPDKKRIVSPSSFAFSWTGGSPLLGHSLRPIYRVFPGDLFAKHAIHLRTDLGGSALKSDATYYIRLQAVDLGLARSSWSVEISSYIYKDLPPQGRTVTRIFPSSVTVAYAPVGAGAYFVDASTAPDFSGVLLSTKTAAPGLVELSPQGLSADTTYYLRMGGLWQRTTTFADAVPVSTVTLALQPALGADPFPDIQRSSMTVSWSGSGNRVSQTTYTVVLTTAASYPNAHSGNVSLSTVPQGAEPTARLDGLAANTTYYLFVAALNSVGTGSGFTAIGAASTLAEVPAAAPVPFPGIDGTLLHAAWGAGGNPLSVTTYTVQLSTAPDFNAGAVDQVAITTAPGGSPEADLSGLNLNTTYYLRVRAVNHNGVPTEYAVFGATATLAAAPPNAAFLEVSTASAVVSWLAGGNPPVVTTYTLVLSTGSSPGAAFTGDLSLTTAPAGTSPVATASGLSPNTTYNLFLNAVNHNGIPTPFSALGSTPTLALPPGAAPDPFPLVGVTTIAAAWSPLAPAPSSAAAEGYLLEASSTNFGALGPGGTLLSSRTAEVRISSLSVSGLVPLTTYYFRVGSLNWGGTANFVGIGSTVTLPSPEIPVLSTGAVHPSSIVWTWTDVPQEIFYLVYSATANAPVSGALPPGTVSFTDTGLSTNTLVSRYLVAVSPVDASTSGVVSAYSGAAAPLGGAVEAIESSSFTVTWDTNTNPSGTAYLVEVSTAPSFDPVLRSTVTLSTAALVAGLTPNTTMFARVAAVNGDGLPSPFLVFPATPTAAAVPLGPGPVSVSSTTILLNWQPNGNPEPGTEYEVWRDLAVDLDTNTAVVSVVSTSAVLAEGLQHSTSYFFRIRARNHLGATSAFAGPVSAITLVPVPTAPESPAGAAQSTSSILWTWTGLPEMLSYRVHLATDPETEIAAVASVAFLQTGLSANATYGIRVRGVNVSGPGELSNPATAHTLAAPPAVLSTAAVHQASATISWSLGANPAGTLAELDWSSDGSAYANALASAAVSYTRAGLLGCTTYYARARFLNGAGIPTAYAGPLSFMTLASTPAAPGDLEASSLAGGRISLSWAPSPSEGVVGYAVYHNGGSGPVDYSSPFFTVSSTVAAITTPPLPVGFSYAFGLRALHRCGTEDENTTVVSQAASLASLSGVRAAVKAPQSGKSVYGAWVTVLAEPTLGDVASIREVKFQFKSAGSSSWNTIAPPDAADFPNPDPSYPYFVHWDVTGLAPGSYDVRAEAAESGGAVDAAPPSVTVVVSALDSDIVEEAAGSGRIRKRQKVQNGAVGTVRASAGTDPVVSEVVIPAGALALSTDTVSIVANPVPSTLPADPPGAASIGVSLSVSLESGQTSFLGGGKAAVTMSYRDDDGDGIVDGTQTRAADLKIYAAEAGGAWVSEFPAFVDSGRRRVTGYTPHFSFFGLFAPTHSAIDSVRVYPNPFKPGSGDPDDGVPYSAGNANSGVIFDNLPPGASVELYSLTGRLVRNLGSTPSGGRLRWDARTESGAEAASGYYFAVIKGSGKERIVKKLAVIR